MYSQIDSNKRKTVWLIAFFCVFVLAIGYFYGQYTGDAYGGLFFAALISLGMTLFSYYSSDKLALAASGAKRITKEDNAYLYRIVENLSITGGIPVPKIHIMQDESINAFATGRDPEHASIAVTTGAIKKLENEELEGVIAHELSHIKNYDIRVMTIVVVLVGLVSLLANWMFRMRMWGGGSRDRNNAGGILMIVGLVLLILSPIIAELIKLAVSRKREFLADASGSLLTRYPEGLARALEKISAEKMPLTHANTATAHLFFSNPFGAKGGWSALWSTHPPLEERIKILRTM